MENEPIESAEYLKDQLEIAKRQIESYMDMVDELNLSVQIANDRWVKQVNENTALELELRKLKR